MKRKISVLFLTLAIIFSILPQTMALETRASDYIFSYAARALPEGDGKLRIYFFITGTGADMDMIGVSSITVYKADGSFVESFSYKYDFPNMMEYDTWEMDSSIPFDGVSGTEYYAKVNFYVRDSNGSDYREYYTDNVIA